MEQAFRAKEKMVVTECGGTYLWSQRLELEGSEVQGYPQWRSRLKTILGYMSLSFTLKGGREG